MESWDSKIPFFNFFVLSNSRWIHGKLWLYLVKLCVCKVDKFWGRFLVSFLKKLILRSANIITLDSDNVLVVTEGEDTIDHSEISYAVINVVVYVYD